MVQFEEMNKTIILHLDGDLNSCKVINIGGILDTLIDKNPHTIAVNCTMLYNIDPATISQIIQYTEKARNKNIELIFFNLNPEVRVTFELMKLNRLFTVISLERFEQEYGKLCG